MTKTSALHKRRKSTQPAQPASSKRVSASIKRWDNCSSKFQVERDKLVDVIGRNWGLVWRQWAPANMARKGEFSIGGRTEVEALPPRDWGVPVLERLLKISGLADRDTAVPMIRRAVDERLEDIGGHRRPLMGDLDQVIDQIHHRTEGALERIRSPVTTMAQGRFAGTPSSTAAAQVTSPRSLNMPHTEAQGTTTPAPASPERLHSANQQEKQPVKFEHISTGVVARSGQ